MLLYLKRWKEGYDEWYLMTFHRWYQRTWMSNVEAWVHNVGDGIHLVRLRALKRGHWYDTDTRMFEAVFQLLVDFVETELAPRGLWLTEHPDVIEFKALSRWQRRKKRTHWRERLGLAYLDEYVKDQENPEHAEWATKVRDLYLWYKVERPARPDPYQKTMVTVAQSRTAFDIQEDYDEEDTRKAQEVVALRRGMWT
jgi:hypothetical protein